jgi:hypothetical protein
MEVSREELVRRLVERRYDNLAMNLGFAYDRNDVDAIEWMRREAFKVLRRKRRAAS